MESPVVWFEIMGQNGDKLRRFYGRLFGWEFEVARPENYGVVTPGSGGIAGGIGQAHRAHPGWITFYTQVPDLAAHIARAEALGSRVLMPPTRFADTEVAVVSDPEGRPVGLCTPAR